MRDDRTGLDQDLDHADTGLEPAPPPRRRAGLLALLVLTLVAAGGIAAWWLTRPSPPAAVATPSPDLAPAPAPAPAPAADPAAPAPGPAPRPADADPQDILRQAARAGSASADRWLEVDGLLRRLAAAVHLVAQGRSPRPVLGFLAPTGRFSALEGWDPAHADRLPEGAAKDDVFVDPASYARYDGIATVLAEADVEAWARGYARLRPHLDRLYLELGADGGRFDDALTRALTRIRSARVPSGLPRLEPEGAIYRFADPELEGADEVTKHMLRLGPDNAKKVQDAAARFARAAGLDARAEAR